MILTHSEANWEEREVGICITITVFVAYCDAIHFQTLKHKHDPTEH